MSNRILTEDGWEIRVRDRLGVNEQYLPDTVLRQPDIITVAEAEIIAILPDYDELTGDERVFLEAATVCACAIAVLASVPARLPQHVLAPHAELRNAVNWNDVREHLENERDRFLSLIQGDLDGVPGFTLGGPRR